LGFVGFFREEARPPQPNPSLLASPPPATSSPLLPGYYGSRGPLFFVLRELRKSLAALGGPDASTRSETTKVGSTFPLPAISPPPIFFYISPVASPGDPVSFRPFFDPAAHSPLLFWSSFAIFSSLVVRVSPDVCNLFTHPLLRCALVKPPGPLVFLGFFFPHHFFLPFFFSLGPPSPKVRQGSFSNVHQRLFKRCGPSLSVLCSRRPVPTLFFPPPLSLMTFPSLDGSFPAVFHGPLLTSSSLPGGTFRRLPPRPFQTFTIFGHGICRRTSTSLSLDYSSSSISKGKHFFFSCSIPTRGHLNLPFSDFFPVAIIRCIFLCSRPMGHSPIYGFFPEASQRVFSFPDPIAIFLDDLTVHWPFGFLPHSSQPGGSQAPRSCPPRY